MTEAKKFGKPKVKIVPLHLWPSLFLTIGVYDVMRDAIFIKGGLSKTTFRQTLKYEKAHRKWFLSHSPIRKFYNFLYWKHAFYFVLAIWGLVTPGADNGTRGVSSFRALPRIPRQASRKGR